MVKGKVHVLAGKDSKSVGRQYEFKTMKESKEMGKILSKDAIVEVYRGDLKGGYVFYHDRKEIRSDQIQDVIKKKKLQR
jgi:hypothetical protein